ncbi:MAG: hypothetical protein J6M66_04095 [Lachnospiraceae bacterium]|nr:hypothetical protein [Lachnospiraceae bacterium]
MDYDDEKKERSLQISPEVKITYFIPDERKAGGRYETVTGKISRIDRYKGTIIMGKGVAIPVKEVVNIEC